MNCLKFKTIKRNRNNNVAVLHARLYRHRSTREVISSPFSLPKVPNTTEYRSTRSPTLVKTCPLFFNAHVRKYAINTPF